MKTQNMTIFQETQASLPPNYRNNCLCRLIHKGGCLSVGLTTSSLMIFILSTHADVLNVRKKVRDEADRCGNAWSFPPTTHTQIGKMRDRIVVSLFLICFASINFLHLLIFSHFIRSKKFTSVLFAKAQNYHMLHAGLFFFFSQHPSTQSLLSSWWYIVWKYKYIVKWYGKARECLI